MRLSCKKCSGKEAEWDRIGSFRGHPVWDVGVGLWLSPSLVRAGAEPPRLNLLETDLGQGSAIFQGGDPTTSTLAPSSQTGTDPASDPASDPTAEPGADEGRSAPPQAPDAPPPRPRRFARLRNRGGLIAVGVTTLLAVVAGAAAVSVDPSSRPATHVEAPAAPAHYELPPLLTDLRPSRRQHFISTTIVVELDADAADVLAQRETQVIDALRSLLRDYERTDLAGESGASRFRADAVVVINRVLAPARARTVLFKELLVD